jgi:hypothetical protein
LSAGRMPFRGHEAATAVPWLKRTGDGNSHQYRNLSTYYDGEGSPGDAARDRRALKHNPLTL